jgi:hypothetical protein
MRNAGMSASGPSPLAANLNVSTPLSDNIEILDLGGNPNLAWSQAVQDVFASSDTAGYALLHTL